MKSVLEAVPPIAADKPAFNGARIEEVDSQRVSQINQLSKRGIQQMVKRDCRTNLETLQEGEKYEADTAAPRPRAEPLAR